MILAWIIRLDSAYGWFVQFAIDSAINCDYRPSDTTHNGEEEP